MIPLRDLNPSSRPPVVGYTLIVLNVLVFFVEISLEQQLPAFLKAFGFIPARLTSALGSGDLLEAVLPLFTSMFLHGGWLHLIGNMWTLFIFGDNVEDSLGHGRFLLFYLAAGVLAGLSQFATAPFSRIPIVGASGAIAGVMGAYFFLFPGARVLTLIPILFFLVIEVPAYVFLGFWFFLQFYSGTASLAGGKAAGVAFWAHVGGFLAGVLLLLVMAPEKFREAWSRRVSRT
ncbi:MAG: rhomboid family intramembrane serine protease [Deltaproteobacteria bacterium]|nr:rhomboid family intramembrane serine protease [Deltaproteobacteria bacterium]